MNEETEGLKIPLAFVSSVRTDNRTGGYKVTIDVTADHIGTINAMALLTMFQKWVRVEIVEIPK